MLMFPLRFMLTSSAFSLSSFISISIQVVLLLAILSLFLQNHLSLNSGLGGVLDEAFLLFHYLANVIICEAIIIKRLDLFTLLLDVTGRRKRDVLVMSKMVSKEFKREENLNR